MFSVCFLIASGDKFYEAGKNKQCSLRETEWLGCVWRESVIRSGKVPEEVMLALSWKVVQ